MGEAGGREFGWLRGAQGAAPWGGERERHALAGRGWRAGLQPAGSFSAPSPRSPGPDPATPAPAGWPLVQRWSTPSAHRPPEPGSFELELGSGPVGVDRGPGNFEAALGAPAASGGAPPSPPPMHLPGCAPAMAEGSFSLAGHLLRGPGGSASRLHSIEAILGFTKDDGLLGAFPDERGGRGAKELDRRPGARATCPRALREGAEASPGPGPEPAGDYEGECAPVGPPLGETLPDCSAASARGHAGHNCRIPGAARGTSKASPGAAADSFLAHKRPASTHGRAGRAQAQGPGRL